MGLIAADDMSEREQALLWEFTRDVTDASFRAGYIGRSWNPNDAVCLRLRGYHLAGLTPDEAAQAMFATHH